MPTLAGINGASLVPDIQGAFQRAGQGVIAGRQFGRDMQADDLAQQAAGGDTDALALLGRIDPQAAMITSDIVKTQDMARARQLAEMKEKRVREAALFLNTPAEKRPQALLQLATSLRDAGEDFSHIVELSQMPADRQEMEARRIIAMGAGIDEVLSPLFGSTDAATRNFQYLTEGLSPEEVERARRIELGLAPRAVGSSALTTAESGRTDMVAESQSLIKERVTRAEQEAKNATGQVKEYFQQLGNIEANIGNYSEAIRLIDEGAGTGVIQRRLPSLRAASQKLDNIKNRLGLDVVGNTTFGALSESELQFALDTALPDNLEGPELKQWLIQKRESQTKLADYLSNAIQFLSVPGNTIADLQATAPRQNARQPQGAALQVGAPQSGGIKFLGFE